MLQVPGWSNIFTQPIINRIEMLSTGVRTDIGVKVFGAGPGHDRPRLQGHRGRAQADQRRSRRDRRADHGQGLPADRHRPRERPPLRHLRRRHSERDRSRAGGPGRDVHGREARSVSGAHSLCPRRSRGRGEHSAAADQLRQHGDVRRHGATAMAMSSPRKPETDAAPAMPNDHAADSAACGQGQAADSARAPWPTSRSSKGRR